MTPQQIVQIEALSRCTFSPGSAEKRFVRDMFARERTYSLSERQDAFLNRLAHRYRRQLDGCKATECACQTTASIFDRLGLATPANGWRSQFVALRVYHNPVTGDSTYAPASAGGYPGLSLFKLLRNARKAAGPDGFVVRLELSMLPFVATDATDARVDEGNKLDEEAFAERQMLYWERELQRVRSARR